MMSRANLLIRSTLCLLLAFCLVFACPACSGEPESTNEPASTTTNDNPDELFPVITIAWLQRGQQPKDLELVENAVNELVKPRLGIKVDLQPTNMDIAQYRFILALSSKEKIDLMLTYPNTYQTLVAQGHLQEIGPLLDQYGQGIQEALGKYLEVSRINNKIYGVRPISDFASGCGLGIRKDIADAYNITADQIKSLDDVGQVMRLIKNREPDMTPLINAQSSSLLMPLLTAQIDTLGDSLGVLMTCTQNTTVSDLYETPEYAGLLKTIRHWYQDGLIYENAATSSEDMYAVLEANQAYAFLTPTKPGITKQTSLSMPFYIWEFISPLSTTSNISIFQWVVPVSCQYPEKAVQMLNLMYSDAEVENLLAWGVEGRHYEKKADGTIGYPAGIDEKSSGYNLKTPWMMGNEFLTHVWQGNDPDLWEQTRKFNEQATISKGMGFTFDQTPVRSELAALRNLLNEYCMVLECGVVDPEIALPVFIENLKASGIDRVVAEKQRQIDQWALAKQS